MRRHGTCHTLGGDWGSPVSPPALVLWLEVGKAGGPPGTWQDLEISVLVSR